MIEININPVAFAIGPVEVRWYGILIALGILQVVLWMMWQVRRGGGLSYDTVFNAAIVGIPSGIIISRLLHVIDFSEYYIENPQLIIGGEGLTIYGALLGGTLGIWIYSRFSSFRFAYMFDLMVPSVILAQAIGRVGCVINGCCYGDVCSLPWAIVYTHPGSLAPSGIPVHPTQVYEIIYLLVIFGVTLSLRGRLRPDGSLFMVYLGFYSLWRLGIDFIREGTSFLFFFGLHQAQVIALVVLAIVVPVLIRRRRRVGVEEVEG